jgi:PKD repeat protein
VEEKEPRTKYVEEAVYWQRNDPGTYTVSLTVSGGGGKDTATKVDYITVYEAAQADFSGSPVTAIALLEVIFTNLSSGDYDTCSWTFGDGGVRSSCSNPYHTYDDPGTYTVSLTVSGIGGEDTETKVGYIIVDIEYRLFILLALKG